MIVALSTADDSSSMLSSNQLASDKMPQTAVFKGEKCTFNFF